MCKLWVGFLEVLSSAFGFVNFCIILITGNVKIKIIWNQLKVTSMIVDLRILRYQIHKFLSVHEHADMNSINICFKSYNLDTG